MSKCTLTAFCVAVMAAPGARTAGAAPWVKGYVVAFYDHMPSVMAPGPITTEARR
jgi:hypothetical protein